MKNWLVAIVLGLVVVLGESSLIAWPLVLWYVWWVAEMDEKWLLVMIVVWGCWLDVLTVRWIGVSAIGLLMFWAGWRQLTIVFRGSWQAEVGWLVVTSLIWYGWLGGGGKGLWGWVVVGIAVVAMVVARRQLVGSRDIRLLRE